MQISKKQRQEWTENPVTLALKEIAKFELKETKAFTLADNIEFGDALLTHENCIKAAWRELQWSTIIELLEGDWFEWGPDNAPVELDDGE